MNNKVELHENICTGLNVTYYKKNSDYGDSFAKLRDEMPNAILVRIYDKYRRLHSLLNGKQQLVNDESVEDTLSDLANYCIMELVERRLEKMQGEQNENIK